MIENYLKRLISSKKKSFTKTEIYFSEYFISLGDELLDKTITNLSEETNSSTASIFKFIKKLGFKGYKDFKINLASNNANIDYKDTNLLTAITNIDLGDDPDTIAKKLMLFNIQSMYTLLEDIKSLKLKEALKLINESKIIHFFGMGGSNAIAFDCYHKFLRTSYKVNYVQDFHLQLSYTTKLNSEDCIFIFSHSGKSKESIEIAKSCKKSEAKVISLTSNPKSDLVKISDISMILPTIEYTYGSEALNARILYLTVMDSILISLMYEDVDKNKKAINKIRDVLSVTKKRN